VQIRSSPFPPITQRFLPPPAFFPYTKIFFLQTSSAVAPCAHRSKMERSFWPLVRSTPPHRPLSLFFPPFLQGLSACQTQNPTPGVCHDYPDFFSLSSRQLIRHCCRRAFFKVALLCDGSETSQARRRVAARGGGQPFAPPQLVSRPCSSAVTFRPTCGRFHPHRYLQSILLKQAPFYAGTYLFVAPAAGSVKAALN